jgi:hypothetical protein
MDPRQAAQTLEVIRTLMERTCQYQLLTAKAGLATGTLAGVGALLFTDCQSVPRLAPLPARQMKFDGPLAAP